MCSGPGRAEPIFRKKFGVASTDIIVVPTRAQCVAIGAMSEVDQVFLRAPEWNYDRLVSVRSPFIGELDPGWSFRAARVSSVPANVELMVYPFVPLWLPATRAPFRQDPALTAMTGAEVTVAVIPVYGRARLTHTLVNKGANTMSWRVAGRVIGADGTVEEVQINPDPTVQTNNTLPVTGAAGDRIARDFDVSQFDQFVLYATGTNGQNLETSFTATDQ